MSGQVLAFAPCSECSLGKSARACQHKILRGASRYARKRHKLLQHCRDALNRGEQLFRDDAGTDPIADPSDCDEEAGVARLLDRLREKSYRRLDEARGGACSENEVAKLNACAATVEDLASATKPGCLFDSQDGGVDALIAGECGRPLAPEESSLRNCQEAIARAGASYAAKSLRALGRCADSFLRGRTLYIDDAKTTPLGDPRDCPSERRAGRSLARAGEKARATVAAACSDTLLAQLAGCAATLDALVSPDARGGCLITGHDAAIDEMLTRVYCDGNLCPY